MKPTVYGSESKSSMKNELLDIGLCITKLIKLIVVQALYIIIMFISCITVQQQGEVCKKKQDNVGPAVYVTCDKHVEHTISNRC